MTTISTVKVQDDCISKWNQLKKEHKYRYIIFTFSQNLQYIEVEKTAPPEKTYDDFIEDLPKNDVRYAIFHLEYFLEDESYRNKFIFITWAPDEAPIRQKMLIASNKRTVKNYFPGIAPEIACVDS